MEILFGGVSAGLLMAFFVWMLKESLTKKMDAVLQAHQAELDRESHRANKVFDRKDEARAAAAKALHESCCSFRLDFIRFELNPFGQLDAVSEAIAWCFQMRSRSNTLTDAAVRSGIVLPEVIVNNAAVWSWAVGESLVDHLNRFLAYRSSNECTAASEGERRDTFKKIAAAARKEGLGAKVIDDGRLLLADLARVYDAPAGETPEIESFLQTPGVGKHQHAQ
jgi:hypothetical protein